MKRIKLVLAMILSVFMALSLFMGCNSNDGGGGGGGGGVVPPPEPEIHTCESKCPICEGCLNESCQDDACKTKCNGGDKTYYKFEGEDEKVNKCGGTLGELGIGSEFGSNQKYVANFNANIGASINFYVDSSEATVASLIVSVCKRTKVSLFTNVVAVLVNGEMIDRSAIVPSNGLEGDTWVDFVEVNLGCINLKQGRNVIKFAIMDSDAGAGYNFNYMALKSANPVVWYEGAHICESVCADCGKCTNLGCKDPACAQKCEVNWTRHKFLAIDNNTKVGGGAFKSVENDYIGGLNGTEGASVTFNIFTENAQEARLFVNVCNRAAANKFDESFILTVNGEVVSSLSPMPTGGEEWNAFAEVDVGIINLKTNKNEIKLTNKSSDAQKGYNLRDICIATLKEVTWSTINQFAAIDDRVTISGEGNAFKNPIENCLGMSKAKDQIVTFNIMAYNVETVNIIFSFCHKGTAHTFNDAFKFIFNGTEILSEASMPTGGREWFDYQDVTVAPVDLIVGKNTIQLVGKDEVNTVGYNVKYLFIDAAGELDWFKEVASGYKFEAENADSNAWPPVDKLWKQETAKASGGWKVGHIYDASLENKTGDERYYLSFSVNAAAECDAELLISLALGSSSIKASAFPLRVNDVDIAVDKTLSNSGENWANFEEFSLATIHLTAGVNTIKIFIGEDAIADMDYIKFVSTTVISAVTVAQP